MIDFDVVKSDLQDRIDIVNDVQGTSSDMSLYQIYIDILSNSGQIIDDQLYEVNSNHDDLTIAAFARDLERGILHVFFCDYSSQKDIEKIYQKDVVHHFKRAQNLLFDSLFRDSAELDDGDPIIDLINDIHHHSNKYNRIIFWNFTNKLYSSREISGLTSSWNNFELIYNCFDINYYYSLLTDSRLSEINIVTDLNAIKVISTDSYTSYLFSISGIELCEYYDLYGKRLLESNVRTFLSLRGETNKGIYNTIHSDDQRPFFFAYNNGLTATCASVTYENGSITSLSDLQIVNGGQTMSTIYKAWKDGKSLKDVFIPVKLSVIHDLENKSLFITKISRYANTQNKVSNSDFFSNSYYHRAVKEWSSKIRISIQGQVAKEKWFYERVRGEYLNEQLFATKSGKRQFEKEYPKPLVFDKIASAKAYLSVNQHPYHVSKGAQLCFAQFALRVSELYDDQNNRFTEVDYKKLISQIILFRTFEKVVSGSDWYTGGYRAQTVAYTISSFLYLLGLVKKTIDWDYIWMKQAVSDDVLNEMLSLGSSIHKLLISPPPGNANVGTYAKLETCWKRIKDSPLKISTDLTGLITFEEQKEKKKGEIQAETQLKGVYAQMAVLELVEKRAPEKLFVFYNSSQSPSIRDRDRGVLKSLKEGRIGYPSEPQAVIILELLRLAQKVGFEL
jgi:hypothetical protein